MSALVSVVMPTYNQARYIGRSIVSVLAQTYRDIELIVVDNHSTDGTRERVQEFTDERVHYFQFRNNGVIAASRNFGAARATGEFIAFIDSDDVWSFDKLREQMGGFREADVVLVASGAWLVAEDGEVRGRALVGTSRRGFRDYSYDELLQESPIITSSVVARSAVFVEVSGFDESPEFVCAEDYDLWLRMARFGRARIFATPLVYYLMGRDLQRNRVEETARGLHVLEKHGRLGYVTDVRVRDNARGAIYRAMATLALDVDAKRSRAYFAKAFRSSTRLVVKSKAAFGYVATYLPAAPRRSVFALLARARTAIYRALEHLWGKQGSPKKPVAG